MQVRLRDIRRAKRMTLADLAARCDPPTTPQTIGRLETGMRTMSVGWLNRIAAALGVDPSELVTHPDRPDVPVVALLTADGPEAPQRAMLVAPPTSTGTQLGLVVQVAQGDYRAKDQLWLEKLEGDAMARALNRDCLIPLRAGDFAFGRLLDVGKSTITLQVWDTRGGKSETHPRPAWLGVAATLIRTL
jgi:transcriptional regulator with XRE-family HTH domain